MLPAQWIRLPNPATVRTTGSWGTPFGSRAGFNSPDLKRVPVLDHPLKFLTFLHLQRSRQGSRADKVILAVLTTSLNHFQFAFINHSRKLALYLVISKHIFSHLLRSREKIDY